MPDVLPVKHVAVVRTMQDSLGTVQHDPKSRAREGFDRGTEMMDQGFHVPPVNVAADRVVENRQEKLLVLVAHGQSIGNGTGR